MATVNPTITFQGDDTVIFTYTPLTSSNAVGAPIGKQWAAFADRNVQVLGTFGAGTAVVEGSNDGGTTYATLTDQSDNALSTTAALIEQITQVPQLTRPSVTGANGSTSLTFVFTCRRNRIK